MAPPSTIEASGCTRSLSKIFAQNSATWRSASVMPTRPAFTISRMSVGSRFSSAGRMTTGGFPSRRNRSLSRPSTAGSTLDKGTYTSLPDRSSRLLNGGVPGPVTGTTETSSRRGAEKSTSASRSGVMPRPAAAMSPRPSATAFRISSRLTGTKTKWTGVLTVFIFSLKKVSNSRITS